MIADAETEPLRLLSARWIWATPANWAANSKTAAASAMPRAVILRPRVAVVVCTEDMARAAIWPRHTRAEPNAIHLHLQGGLCFYDIRFSG